MKKRCALIITTILFLITGCTNEKIKFSESDAWKTKWQTREEREVAKIVPYQNGFYYENLQSCLSYFDIPSSKTIVLCNKNGCNHKNKKCFAYMENQQMPMIHDDQLLFVSYEGEVSTAEVDNTEKRKKWSLFKELKEKGANIAVWETLVTDDYLYVKANITEYTKDAGGITEERIYAFDFKKKAEIMLTEVPEEEQTISLISANDGVIYYSCQDENMRELNIDNITIEQYKEAERTMHTGIYRVDMEDAKPELVKTVDNGMVLTANDDYGVIYAQYMGNGFFEGKNLVQYDYSNRTEKEIFAMEGEKGFSFQMKNAEYVWIRSGNEDYNIYKLTTMKKVDIPWEYPAQASSAHPVPGGFAVPKEELKEGQVKKTGGEEWRFIAVQ